MSFVGSIAHSVMVTLTGAPVAINYPRSAVLNDNRNNKFLSRGTHPAEAKQRFLTGDTVGFPASSRASPIDRALGKVAQLSFVLARGLQASWSELSRTELAQGILASLVVDTSEGLEQLGWPPRVTVDQALQETAQRLLETVRRG